MSTEDDLRFMKLAIDEAKKCCGEDGRTHPAVGAVVVKDGNVLTTAHRGELTGGEHAEYTALEKKLTSEKLAGANVYTPLEPCTSRNHPKVPCAERLIERRVKRVVIGMLDPNPNICGRGLWLLREASIETDLFPHALLAEIEELNREFIRDHRPKAHLTSTSHMSGAQVAPASEPEAQPSESDAPSLIDLLQRGELDAADAEYDKIRKTVEGPTALEQLRIRYLNLKAVHAKDGDARTELEKATVLPVAGTQAASHLIRILERFTIALHTDNDHGTNRKRPLE